MKNATGIETSDFLLKKSDLVTSKSDADKLDFAKLKNMATFFSSLKSKLDELDVDKLVPEKDVIKKDVYNAKIKNIEDKIPDITNLATNTTLNAKIN